ncbi:hypothetical protein BH10BDE1_BH10BDE1_03730 [soil metagenome]
MMRLPLALILSALGLLAFTINRAEAYPEMVAHGYTHCTACHTNVAGGGTLNEYGRNLSREILSQKTLNGKVSPEGDEKFLWGTVELPKWLQLAGDIRTLQLLSESSVASRARFMIMQVDLDADLTLSPWLRSFLSVGRIEPRVDQPTAMDFVTIPRVGFDIALSPDDSAEKWNLRLGRFLPTFGIAFAEHTLASRMKLDFGPGQERYGAELSWLTEHSSLAATFIALQANGNQNKAERGGILQYSHSLGEKAKFNLSFYQSVREASPGGDYTRTVFGASVITQLPRDWYAMLEIDRPQGADSKWGLIEVLKIGNEIFQGLHAIGIQEYQNGEFDQANPRFESYGAGLEWYPRPHWELSGIFRRERNTAIRDEFDNVVWLIGHFYL